MTPRARPITALLFVAAIALAGCGGIASTGQPDGSPEPFEASESEQTTESEPSETTEDPSPSASEGADDGEPTEEPDGSDGTGEGSEIPDNPGGAEELADAELPGESVMTFFTEPRTANVVRVAAGDALFVRASPDPRAAEVGQLPPTGEVALAGRERQIDEALWTEVRLNDGVGWVNVRFLGFLGESRDITSEVANVGARENGETLAADIAQTWPGHTEEAGMQRVTVLRTDDDLRYVIDVVGYRDTSIRGERLDLRFEPSDDGVELQSAESTWICIRGVGESGLCT